MSEAYYDHRRMMAEDVPCVVVFDNMVKRRARVWHECSHCSTQIAPTQTYYRTSYRDDDDNGKFKVVKHCAPCRLRDMGFDHGA